MNKNLLVLFYLVYITSVVSCDGEMATYGYIAINMSEVKDSTECIEHTPEAGSSPVTKVSCHNGKVIKSYYELGFFRIFYASGVVEKTYVDRARYPLWDHVIKYPDGWRQIVFRDGRVFTQKPDGSYRKSNT